MKPIVAVTRLFPGPQMSGGDGPYTWRRGYYGEAQGFHTFKDGEELDVYEPTDDGREMAAAYCDYMNERSA